MTSHYHFHPFHRHLHISWAITAESSPLHTKVAAGLEPGIFGFRVQVTNHYATHPVKLCFIEEIAFNLNEFFARFQTSAPMVPFLADSLESLICNVAEKLILTN